MRINQNAAAFNAWRNLGITDGQMNKSLEKLSSGLRINRAADDAAGLAVSEKMRSQVRGFMQAMRNAQDGVSLIQTAEGALNETHSVLQRIRELAVQASSDTLTDADRTQLQLEVTELIAEVDRIATDITFNTQVLLDGTFSGVIQVGPNSGDTVTVAIGDMQSTALTINLSTVATQIDATAALTAVDTAIGMVSSERATLGAQQNRLEHTIASLGVSAENLQAAESRIRDVDMALEMTNFTRSQILIQAGTAMLAQANSKPQAVLQLLQ